MAKTSKQDVSYLGSLKFNKGLLKSYQARYLSNIRFVVMLILTILILGTVSFIQIPRRLNPEIKIPIVTVQTILPGGAPEDIESLITNPIEDSLKSIKGIDTMSSVSSENASAVVLQFVSGIDPDKARLDVEKEVNNINDLPEDATTPSIQVIDFENEPIWNFILYSDKDVSSLMRFSDELKKKIEDLPKVDRVVTAGFDESIIEVGFDMKKLESLNLNPFLLSQLIRKSTVSYPAGTIQSSSGNFALGINTQITSIKDLRNLKINVNGQPIRLGDISQISEKPKSKISSAFYANKHTSTKKGVQFFVYKTSTSDIDDAEKSIKEIVNKEIENKQSLIQIKTVQNTAEEVATQFSDLFREFRSTIILVFILLFIFLGIRQALIATLTIPLTFLSSFAIINALGMSLNFLTMFAFLLSLGLLIDDTIVAVAAMTRYYKTGKFTPYETGILVWKDFIVPLWSTTITTIWAFVPLLLASGIIGEFIKPLPLVVTATMLSSTSIAVLITIPLMIVFLKPNIPKRVKKLIRLIFLLIIILIGFAISPKNVLLPISILLYLSLIFIFYLNRKTFIDRILNIKIVSKYLPLSRRISNSGLINIENLSRRYIKIIRNILNDKKKRTYTIVAITAFVIVGYILLPIGLVKGEFFPKVDQNILYVSVNLPLGSSEEKVEKEAHVISEKLRKTKYIDFLVSETGQKFDGQQGRARDQNSFLVTIHLVDKEERQLSSQEISEQIRKDLLSYQKGEVSIQELSGGPPAGADVEVKLIGEDLNTLDKLADELILHLEKTEGISDPDKSIKSGSAKFVFNPNEERLQKFGISIDTIGLWMRLYANGFELDNLKRDREEIPVEFKFSQETTPDNLNSLLIPTNNEYTSLLSLGELKLSNNPSQITHENGLRTISVFASVKKGFNINQKNTEFQEYLNKKTFPNGYTWKTGGVNEENQKSVNSILRAMVVSALLILITMVIEFKSYRQSFLALLIIPISISSVFYIFGLFGIPLSFPALIGILALFGIVVTHAIVVIEKINDNRKEGLELMDAIIDAAGSRLEPVLLTSLATIIGLIPITIADPLWRGLGGAIIAGLLFSGMIKLFLVPIIYYNFYKDEEKKISSIADLQKT